MCLRFRRYGPEKINLPSNNNMWSNLGLLRCEQCFPRSVFSIHIYIHRLLMNCAECEKSVFCNCSYMTKSRGSDKTPRRTRNIRTWEVIHRKATSLFVDNFVWILQKLKTPLHGSKHNWLTFNLDNKDDGQKPESELKRQPFVHVYQKQHSELLWEIAVSFCVTPCLFYICIYTNLKFDK